MSNTPEQKAKELVEKFIPKCAGSPRADGVRQVTANAKQCAIIAVEEIKDVYKQLSEDDDIMFPEELKFWNQVLEELKK
jgi:hypothetical protein